MNLQKLLLKYKNLVKNNETLKLCTFVLKTFPSYKLSDLLQLPFDKLLLLSGMALWWQEEESKAMKKIRAKPPTHPRRAIRRPVIRRR